MWLGPCPWGSTLVVASLSPLLPKSWSEHGPPGVGTREDQREAWVLSGEVGVPCHMHGDGLGEQPG